MMSAAPSQPVPREYRCVHCGGFFAATNAPGGRITAYCRGCRRVRTVLIGKVEYQAAICSSTAA